MKRMLPSRSAVKKAGQRAANAGDPSKVSSEDLKILDEWRKAHLQPLTAISMWLRNPSIKETNLSPAQRLKRRDTLLDKIISGRARDASTMHDLGGCRLIFPDIDTLERFRTYLEDESRAQHKLVHARDKYDYILEPKHTGYRGVHYIYGYQTRASTSYHLNGLKIEVQLRTSVQHAWATAVEIADLVFDQRTKFEDGSGNFGEFFRISSELLARSHENRYACLPEYSFSDLINKFHEVERETQLLDRLAKLREQGDTSLIREHTVLAFKADDTLEIFGYTKSSRAVIKESELLSDPDCINVVYVRAATPAAIRSSYRNYLTNPADFVELMERAIQ